MKGAVKPGIRHRANIRAIGEEATEPATSSNAACPSEREKDADGNAHERAVEPVQSPFDIRYGVTENPCREVAQHIAGKGQQCGRWRPDGNTQ